MTDNTRSNGPWRYQLQKDYTVTTPHLKDIYFRNEWLRIENGVVTISKHYAWDGCTPKYYLPIIGWVGIPDGPINSCGYPQVYYASLVHDALCQFRTSLFVDKQDTISVLKQLMLEGGCSKFRTMLYTMFVGWFGPQDWLGRLPPLYR